MVEKGYNPRYLLKWDARGRKSRKGKTARVKEQNSDTNRRGGIEKNEEEITQFHVSDRGRRKKKRKKLGGEGKIT